MRAKEKALELFNRFFNEQTEIVWTDDEGILKNAENNYLKNKDEQDVYWKKLALHSALIAVSEIKNYCNGEDELYFSEVEHELLNI